MTCNWVRAFDGHFNISCPNGQRGNGHFKPTKKFPDTKWNFQYCPYCGKEIKVIESEEL